ncbi:MAG: hypothetical protein KBD44_02265 [Candidatus Pacebacteria bacterium]|nr:hypothetical protein [Candidatus Paceibacterota bacterium]
MLRQLWSAVRRFFNRPAVAFATVSTVALAVFLFTFAFAPTPASAGGGCETTMSADAAYFEIEFSGGVTETLPGPNVNVGGILCVEAPGAFDVGFKGAEDFFLNGSHIKPAADAINYFDGARVFDYGTFLVTGSSVQTTFQWAPSDAAIIQVYVGSLRPATRPTVPPAAAQPTPPPAWSALTLPAKYKTGDVASWDVKVMTGTIHLEVSSLVEFPFKTPNGVVTPTLSVTTGYYTYNEVVVEGMYSAPLLTARAGTWNAVFTGEPGAILRMKSAAPAPQASPASTSAPASAGGKMQVWKSAAGNFFTDGKCAGGAVVFDPARHVQVGTCGGGRGKIAGAPAPMRFPNLPLVVKP